MILLIIWLEINSYLRVFFKSRKIPDILAKILSKLPKYTLVSDYKQTSYTFI